MIRGIPELQARLDAVGRSAPDVARLWAESAAQEGRFAAPVQSGRTQRSVKVGDVDERHATVTATGGGKFVETGVRAHTITAHGDALRFKTGGRTIFARKVDKPRQPPRAWLQQAGAEALRKTPLIDPVVEAWNRAA